MVMTVHTLEQASMSLVLSSGQVFSSDLLRFSLQTVLVNALRTYLLMFSSSLGWDSFKATEKGFNNVLFLSGLFFQLPFTNICVLLYFDACTFILQCALCTEC